MKLRFIANGIGGNPLKLEQSENKFNTKIFPSHINNNLENIDDDLTSLVFTYLDKNKDKIISSYDSKIFFKTKKLMIHYEAYNILMSKKFRKFIINTKNYNYIILKQAKNLYQLFKNI